MFDAVCIFWITGLATAPLVTNPNLKPEHETRTYTMNQTYTMNPIYRTWTWLPNSNPIYHLKLNHWTSNLESDLLELKL